MLSPPVASIAELLPLSKVEVERLSMVIQARLEGVEPVQVDFARTIQTYPYSRTVVGGSPQPPSDRSSVTVDTGVWRQFRQTIYCEIDTQGPEAGLVRYVWGSGGSFNSIDSLIEGSVEDVPHPRRLPFAIKTTNLRTPPAEARGTGLPGDIMFNWLRFPLHKQITQFGDPARVTSPEVSRPDQTLYLFDQEPGFDGKYGAPVLIGWDESTQWIAQCWIMHRRVSEMGISYEASPCLEVSGVDYPVFYKLEITDRRVPNNSADLSNGKEGSPRIAVMRNYYQARGLFCTETRLEMQIRRHNSRDISLNDWLEPGPLAWALVRDALNGEEWFESAGRRLVASDYLMRASQDAARMSSMLGRRGYVHLADADVDAKVSCGIPAIWLFMGLMGKPRALSEICAVIGEDHSSLDLSLEDLHRATLALGAETVAAQVDIRDIDILEDPIIAQLSGGPYSEPHFAVACTDHTGVWIASPPESIKLLGKDVPSHVFTGFCLMTSRTARSLGLLGGMNVGGVPDALPVPPIPPTRFIGRSEPVWFGLKYFAFIFFMLTTGLILRRRRARRKSLGAHGGPMSLNLIVSFASLSVLGCDTDSDSVVVAGKGGIDASRWQTSRTTPSPKNSGEEDRITLEGLEGDSPRLLLVEGSPMSDLGLVDKGSVVTLNYIFVNPTSKNIRIDTQSKTCSCTELTSEPSILMPGQEGSLTLKSVIDQNVGTLVSVSGALFGSFSSATLDSRNEKEDPRELLRVFFQCKVLLGRSICFEPSPIRDREPNSADSSPMIADILVKARLRASDAWPDIDSIHFETTTAIPVSIPCQWSGEPMFLERGDLVEWQRPGRLFLPAELASRPEDFGVRIEGTIEGSQFSSTAKQSNPSTRESELMTKTLLIGDLLPGEPRRIELSTEWVKPSSSERTFRIETVPSAVSQSEGGPVSWRITEEAPQHLLLELIPAPTEGRLELLVVCSEGVGPSSFECGRWRLLGWILPRRSSSGEVR